MIKREVVMEKIEYSSTPASILKMIIRTFILFFIYISVAFPLFSIGASPQDVVEDMPYFLRQEEKKRVNPQIIDQLLQRRIELPDRIFLSHLLTPVRFQGLGRTSCVSFTVTALMESQLIKERSITTDLSEQWLHFVQKMS
jgi:hypothetical protein